MKLKTLFIFLLLLCPTLFSQDERSLAEQHRKRFLILTAEHSLDDLKRMQQGKIVPADSSLIKSMSFFIEGEIKLLFADMQNGKL